MSGRAYHSRTSERTFAIVAALLLGLYCQLVVPLYFAFNPIDAATLKSIDGYAIGNVILFAGESPFSVLLGLVILPMLLWPRIPQRRTGDVRIWVAIVLSLLFGIGQIGSAMYAVTDRSIPIFQPAPGCTLITCGLYHTLFHLAQVPFLIAVAHCSFRYQKHLPDTRAGQVKMEADIC